MHADNVPIKPEFTTLDGLRIRHAFSPKDSAETALLFSPWPESLYAFLPIWRDLADSFSLVAVDLPGFGQSEGRPDLMSPQAMGEFIVRFAAELGLQHPHAIGPDIGTGALLFAAATHPGAFRSIVVGAGAATFPLHVDGALKSFIDAETIEPFRQADPADIIRGVVSSIRNYDVPGLVRDDYIQSYTGERFVDSIAYVRNYPADLAVLSPLLPFLTTPVQIIVGRDDPYGLAGDAELLNGELPHSRLNILDTGHCAWEEDPASYRSIVADWINGAFQKA